MSQGLEGSYRHCAQVTRQCARSFYWGMRLLPAEKRRALYAIYAFLRACDDSVDEAPQEVQAGQLDQWRRSLDAVLRGECLADPCLPAFGDAVSRFGIPGEHFHALLDGAEMDLKIRRYATFEALHEYCYRVASTVGLVCIHVWGFEGENARRDAERCGIGFQLTNILRDVREDACRGRVYLPQEDLERFGYGEADIAKGIRDERFLALMSFQADRARGYYRSAQTLVPCVSADSRACLAAMAGIYEGLLTHMERTGFDVYASRVALPRWRKAAFAAKAWWRYRAGRGHAPPPAAGR